MQNTCFAKDVAVRFTLDGWITTNEVGGRYVCGLPEPFPSGGRDGGRFGCASYGIDAREHPPQTWDRFSFSIQLEDFERKPAEKTLEVLVRYTVHGVGEWCLHTSHARTLWSPELWR